MLVFLDSNFPVFLSWLCSYFRAIDNLIREFIVISSMPFMLERSLKASQEINKVHIEKNTISFLYFKIPSLLKKLVNLLYL